MRNTAPVLDFIINQCLLDSERFEKISFQGSLNDFQTIIIHADVIKEHGLVEYYTKVLFHQVVSRGHFDQGRQWTESR